VTEIMPVPVHQLNRQYRHYGRDAHRRVAEPCEPCARHVGPPPATRTRLIVGVVLLLLVIGGG